MATKKAEPRGRKEGRFVIALYNDDKELSLKGIYMNAHHIESQLGISNANVGKYLNGRINTLQGYIAVWANVGNEPLDAESIKKLEDVGRITAKQRQIRTLLIKLTDENIQTLSFEQVNKIHSVVENQMPNGTIEYIKRAWVEDSKGASALLLGDVCDLIKITTGVEITMEQLEKLIR